MNGTSSLTSSGVSSEAGSIPHVSRRRHPSGQLLHPRLGARDLDPAAFGEHVELLYWRMLSSVSAVISLE